jgi:hypothetical protein
MTWYTTISQYLLDIGSSKKYSRFYQKHGSDFYDIAEESLS